ncbi:MAG: F0F1 ATP synthase subunit epsilon [Nitrospirae bacterium]|nr:F0F1 ATP synthase subunit epsilon [Candidatus Manganitrophaceae bacterium]
MSEMNDRTFHLTVVTPQQIFFDGQVRALLAPGGAGSFGLLVNHAPMISTLLPGRLVLTSAEGEKQFLTIGPGFLDVLNNEVTLVTESVTEEEGKKSH